LNSFDRRAVIEQEVVAFVVVVFPDVDKNLIETSWNIAQFDGHFAAPDAAAQHLRTGASAGGLSGTFWLSNTFPLARKSCAAIPDSHGRLPMIRDGPLRLIAR
jgi:hypothetical protein